MRLANKIAVVVGAGQQPGETMGNGRAVSLRFAEEGATVLCVDLNADWAQDTVRMIEAKGGKASALAANVAREDDCKAISDTCVQRYGRIDILHNNVGFARGDGGTVDLDPTVWDDMMAANLKGMYMTCKHVLPVMQRQRSGVIINISSTSSLAGQRALAYMTSKGAVNTMTKHIARESAPYGIRVNAILPGLVDTPIAIERRARERNIDRATIRAERKAQVPLEGPTGSSADVANAALFLASDEARYITGVLLPVDGGLLLKVG